MIIDSDDEKMVQRLREKLGGNVMPGTFEALEEFLGEKGEILRTFFGMSIKDYAHKTIDNFKDIPEELAERLLSVHRDVTSLARVDRQEDVEDMQRLIEATLNKEMSVTSAKRKAIPYILVVSANSIERLPVFHSFNVALFAICLELIAPSDLRKRLPDAVQKALASFINVAAATLVEMELMRAPPRDALDIHFKLNCIVSALEDIARIFAAHDLGMNEDVASKNKTATALP